ncbi:MAG: esterase, partial [Acidobacteria bacterium]
MIRALVLLLLFSTELLAQHVEYKSFQSKLLARDLRYGVYLPASYNSSPGKKYPVLYFLHGLFEDETRWSTRGQTDQIMDRMIAEGKMGEFIVAIPFGG